MLRKTQEKTARMGGNFSKSSLMVPRAGFEPAALSLEVSCSIQLSYRGTLKMYLVARFARQKLDRAMRFLSLRAHQLSYRGKYFGAGAENRTPISSLENSHTNRCTTPARYTLYHYVSV